MDVRPIESKKFDDSIRKILNICDISHIDALKIFIRSFGIFILFIKESNSCEDFTKFLEENDFLFTYEHALNFYGAIQKELLKEKII